MRFYAPSFRLCWCVWYYAIILYFGARNRLSTPLLISYVLLLITYALLLSISTLLLIIHTLLLIIYTSLLIIHTLLLIIYTLLLIIYVLLLIILTSAYSGDGITWNAISRAAALVQWLNLHAWKVGDCGFKPLSGIHISKKHNVSYPLTRNDSILWGASVTEM